VYVLDLRGRYVPGQVGIPLGILKWQVGGFNDETHRKQKTKTSTKTNQVSKPAQIKNQGKIGKL